MVFPSLSLVYNTYNWPHQIQPWFRQNLLSVFISLLLTLESGFRVSLKTEKVKEQDTANKKKIGRKRKCKKCNSEYLTQCTHNIQAKCKNLTNAIEFEICMFSTVGGRSRSKLFNEACLESQRLLETHRVQKHL